MGTARAVPMRVVGARGAVLHRYSTICVKYTKILRLGKNPDAERTLPPKKTTIKLRHVLRENKWSEKHDKRLIFLVCVAFGFS